VETGQLQGELVALFYTLSSRTQNKALRPWFLQCISALALGFQLAMLAHRFIAFAMPDGFATVSYQSHRNVIAGLQSSLWFF
jgi:hypothetical protein